ncbi:MAG: hypothetical protein LBD54_01845, partial [Puniceicoccales bacterium]|nr:hypothetical protein [Puniceicoccales bacterium]
PLSVTCVLHRSDTAPDLQSDGVFPWSWKSGGSGGNSVSAVRFFNGFGGKVRFQAGWDEAERSDAPRVASLPGGFFKRMLGRPGDRGIWQELRVSGWKSTDELQFHALIVEPGRTRVTWEILPVQDSEDWRLAEIDARVSAWRKVDPPEETPSDTTSPSPSLVHPPASGGAG